MAFVAGSITAFFEELGQMGLSAHTRLTVAAKGIVAAGDLSEFTKDGLETMFQNLRKPPETLVVPMNAGMPITNHPGILTKVQPCVIPAKSKMWLLVALKIEKYYKMTQYHLTPVNMSWAILKNFEEQWNKLIKKKEGAAPPVPKLAEGLHLPK